jgi:ACT domain-containing protein
MSILYFFAHLQIKYLIGLWNALLRDQECHYIIEVALELEGKGMDYKDICKKLGISKSTFYQIVK